VKSGIPVLLATAFSIPFPVLFCGMYGVEPSEEQHLPPTQPVGSEGVLTQVKLQRKNVHARTHTHTHTHINTHKHTHTRTHTHTHTHAHTHNFSLTQMQAL